MELGAGLGYIAAVAADIVGPGNVVAVEAHPDMIPVAAANLARNGFGNVQLIHGAACGAQTEGEVLAFHKARAFWASSPARKEDPAEDVTDVPKVLFSDLLATHEPNFVIMDIEGSEAHLFNAPFPDFVNHVVVRTAPGPLPRQCRGQDFRLHAGVRSGL